MGKTVCLNMIVRDESPVIRRCLASLKHLIDYWVIVDTGSSDGTQTIIRDFLKEIPGVLYERSWVNFGHNRNEALNLAKDKGDYLLFIDADEFLVFENDFTFPELTADVYFVLTRADLESFYRQLFVSTQIEWLWNGALHETLSSSQIKNGMILQGITNVVTHEGHRSQDPNKYLKDSLLLEEMLADDPTNERILFYLAITYADAQNYELALKTFEKRAAMGGDPEQTFYSLLSIALLQDAMNLGSELFMRSYDQAFQFRPTRAEPLYYMARYYMSIQAYLLGYLLSQHALTIPRPCDQGNVKISIYDYELLVQFAEASFALGRMEEACNTYQQLIWKFESYLKTNHLSCECQERMKSVLPGMRQFLCEKSPSKI
jgi:glycosyltransferase involved in cell wall biosynthesis